MKVVTCLSGGMDSTTLLAKLLHEENTVYPVMYDYGQTHQKAENGAAVRIYNFYKKQFPKQLPAPIKRIQLDLRQIGGSALTDKRVKVPTEMKNQGDTVVFFRNQLLVTLAAAYAETLQVQTLAYGPVKEDFGAYPDCRVPYFAALEKALRLGAKTQPNEFTVLIPYAQTWKKDILKWGLSMKVPYELTHTCYCGSAPPCCVDMKKTLEEIHRNVKGCPACLERVWAFNASGFFDPLIVKFKRQWTLPYVIKHDLKDLPIREIPV